MMEPKREIPKDRKQLRFARVCLLVGVAVLLFVVVSQRFVAVAQGL